MSLGYDGKLYILAFDHRGSFQKKMFGIEGDPTPGADGDDLRRQAADLRGHAGGGTRGAPRPSTPACWSTSSSAPTSPSEPGRAISSWPCRSRSQARTSSTSSTARTSAPTSRSFDPDFSKVLVRYNPDDPDTEMNKRQLDRLKTLSDWLHANDRKFLFELLVPATDEQLEDGRRRHRPLRRRAAPRADAPRASRRSRTTGSRSTSGRSRASTSARTPACWPSRPAGARAARASPASCWAAAPRPRRSSSGSRRPPPSRASSASPSAARSGGTRSRASWPTSSSREEAAAQIAENYLHFVRVYERQQVR